MSAGINTKPPIGLLRHVRKARDHEEVPIGAIVRTPLGREAEVTAYRGLQQRKGPERGHRVWLVCRYLEPVNKKFDYVQLLPELAVVLRGPANETDAQKSAMEVHHGA